MSIIAASGETPFSSCSGMPGGISPISFAFPWATLPFDQSRIANAWRAHTADAGMSAADCLKGSKSWFA